jgi:hypothetical protein
MSDAMHSEDLELDDAGAEAVLGGAMRQMTMEQALKAGYHEIACGQHGTLMRNRKGEECLVPYKQH